ncbi:putative disease resistance protein RGA3 [Cucumis melo var. makuwa]|uniref:Putative disease resistance protein RGA3 n=1 Tax=Cucumis melo var. makuwa TaxID=1194695 RepID=A0A5D3CEM5_CUCMM|nr:putative disease resistance protein RGA3 [Cucumis melo var. makuwa]
MIISATSDRNPNVHLMDSLQRELQKVIQGKKYLLVMDDVWNDQNEYEWRELKNLLMDGAARGSKIIITKRDSRVATEIEDMTKSITLDVLDEDSSWSLFKKVAFKQGQDSKYLELEQLGKEILKKCGGVPLVIRHIGRLLSSKTSKEEWTSFNDNESLEITQQDNHMTSILELSYNNLPPHLKQCFAYSSLFPKGYKIKINELIEQWIAQGFIASSFGRKSLDNKGKDYFDELCSRFFYENLSDDNNFDDYVRIHDVMRELAKKVAGNKLYARGDPNNNYVVSEQTRHISFDYKIELWKDVLSKLHKAKGLRTFLLLHHLYEEKNTLDKQTLDKLFSSFPRLRVLGLHDSKISTVPESIEKLTDLRYLDLSENDIESLPNSITKLQNLQTLKLTECHKLKKLPRDTKELENLRHLAFDHCIQITHMPEGMEKLTSLQTITLFVFDCKKSNKLSELNKLNYLKAELKITGLEQLRSIGSILPEVGLVNLKHGWRSLKLEWELSGGDEYEGEGDKTIMECFIPHPYLESLSIKGYCGEKLPEWVSAWPFWKLTQIEIVNCHRLKYLPSIKHLHALSNLRLQNLRSLEFIDVDDSSNSSSSNFFPSLKFIWLQDLPNLIGWGQDTRTSRLPPTFSQLCFLEIFDCPKLIYIPKLPSTRAYVHLCHVGVRLVMRVGSVLSCLGQLKLEQILDMERLPAEFYRHFPTFDEGTSISSTMPTFPRLRWLEIIKCPNLLSLPTWINHLISLETLRIISCPKLKSLPAEIGKLQYLQELQIVDCPELEERCKQGGEDWPKISSIPNITLGQIATDNDTPHLSGDWNSPVGKGKWGDWRGYV